MDALARLDAAADKALTDGTCPAGHPDGTGCGCWDGWAAAIEAIDTGDPCINYSLAPGSRDFAYCEHQEAHHAMDAGRRWECLAPGCHCGVYRTDGADA